VRRTDKKKEIRWERRLESQRKKLRMCGGCIMEVHAALCGGASLTKFRLPHIIWMHLIKIRRLFN
jgi:hypothetical protein